METIVKQYQDQIICIFNAKEVIENKPLLVVKDECELVGTTAFLVQKYSSDFESLLTIKVPTKNRKKKQLISYQQSLDLVKEIAYGVLSFTYDEIPYSVALNHIMVDEKLYFHGGKTGFKLHGTTCPIHYLVVKDLGISEENSTHNHDSVAIQGTMRIVEDFATKKKVLLQLMAERAPSNHKDITEGMTNATEIIEIDMQFVIGKSHIR